MRCLNPRTVGFKSDGKTISWSEKDASTEYASFQLPCSKCIECRLEYARQWAVRCVHESKMHDENSFVTLTYSDENLKSSKLNYEDFQKFMKRLRFNFPNQKIGMFVTGEYGDILKRPHWHALIFNWRPKDLEFKYQNDHGDRVYHSGTLERLWGLGITEVGNITFESAGYCARYAAKKLVHGQDGDHDFHPISKKSSKNAIGKSFVEKYYRDIFSKGFCVLDGGVTCAIPRYYEKWLLKHHPNYWEEYVTIKKEERIQKARKQSVREKSAYALTAESRVARGNWVAPITRLETKKIIIEDKFSRLQKYLKGDI